MAANVETMFTHGRFLGMDWGHELRIPLLLRMP